MMRIKYCSMVLGATLLLPFSIRSAVLPDIAGIQKDAAAGNANAQFNLGIAYLFGERDHTYVGEKTGASVVTKIRRSRE
ncbi:hypothetical protein QDY85_004057 [Salmonella enterica]|nr:hypothetical protein [Salmonella enterica]EEO0182270.1 hypothetical protein [Salmonella enterica]EHF7635415.1 hypothetical protein [Salmonella enterica]EHF7648582.1 hypothetical protein [Salmonella enterica]EHM6110830.1 hypothetical protein [Salmonella enterica]EHX0164724.1 hypothetical protein [Salmonella enterica]